MAVTDTQLANAVRALSRDAVEAANSGRPAMPMSMADMATVLLARYLRYDHFGLTADAIASQVWPNSRS